MGFDLYGLRAKAEKGEYFRNNVWWWHPLAEYVLEHVEIPEKESAYWFTNDGQKVSQRTALKIAATLNELIANGDVKKYEQQYKEFLAKLPLVACWLCKGSGVRNDEQVKGRCNACRGTGKQEDFRTNYPFSEENVKDFAAFCQESGGFQIY
jgi:DnaJ-class molecular chaperone